MREIYDRHAGPYALSVTRQVPGKKGALDYATQWLAGPLSAEEAHEEARALVNDPRDTIRWIYVYSIREQAYIGARYDQGKSYEPWGMDVADERHEGALLPGGPEPVRPVDDPVDGRGDAGPDIPRPVPDVPTEIRALRRASRRGALLEDNPEAPTTWPVKPAPQAVRAALGRLGGRASAQDLAAAVADQVPIQFPVSLISRLKQAGFLREVTE